MSIHRSLIDTYLNFLCLQGDLVSMISYTATC